jgi:hypothetical protein
VTAQPLVYLFVDGVAAQLFAQASGGDLALVAGGVFERFAAAGSALILRRVASLC